ncbi:glycoside hydrolase family 2 TIM barrel-domain containing protein [Lentisphaera profundi]|uniref:Beta-galactosidase n=1 Tax=Lentisphaera profundi TaxID=1658616 RepID=A0ABY7VUL8_9BACT|nr:glycoside hydrolase family 2 TIM barrel-domain containing protein [Lentisphaera profundi]WDE97591.1 glycoside hydrolase family 2 TIM barrel-domain containing protein [Lentisphaera profundi]
MAINPWENPQLVSYSTLSPRAPLYSFDTLPEALSVQDSSYKKSLNGQWDFKLFESPLSACLDVKNWDKIEVPSCWTRQGFKDLPIYTNVQMPFDESYPKVPEKNPTGIYHRKIKNIWPERRSIIHFAGVESMFYLYLNGEEVGMSKGSRTPVEFDLTDFLKQGDNDLHVKVIRWSDGSYIEDQDHWRMAGIFRDVFLYSSPLQFIEDMFARAQLNEDLKSASLKCQLRLGSVKRDLDAYKINVELFDAKASSIWKSHKFCRLSPKHFREYEKTEDGETIYPYHIIDLDAELEELISWNAENPYQYTVVASLESRAGDLIDCVRSKIGFKRVEVKNQELLINGQAVLIKGVNRHEHDEYSGKVVSRETMIKDIRLLKQFNFNAVRNAHYPQPDLWYELCNEYGLYIMDEANIEAHKDYDTICRDPQYAPAFLNRVMRMFHSHKNHACIYQWSTGNESGYGPNHDMALGYLRGIDSSRLVHCEGAVHAEWSQGLPDHTAKHGMATDTFGPMYPEVEDMLDWAKDRQDDPRPYITCEYNHAMGNSNGSLKDYWKAFREVDGLQGGFIWDWVDQGLAEYDKDGEKYWTYGGDYGEEFHDFDFCINGMVWPDRTPKPAMYEFKKCAEPILVEQISREKYHIINDQYFSDFNNIRLHWTLELDGKIIQEGQEDDLVIEAKESLDYAIEMKPVTAGETQILTVNFSFSYIKKGTWHDAGHELTWSQFFIDADQVIKEENINSRVAQLRVQEMDGLKVFHGDQEVLLPELNLYRAGTDNDAIRAWTGQDHKPGNKWRESGLHDLKLMSESHEFENESLLIKRKYMARNHEISHEILIDNELNFSHEFMLPQKLPSLARVGLKYKIPKIFQGVQWLGLGPHENYVDRDYGARFSLYKNRVLDHYVPYILPQSHGNKSGVKYLKLSDGQESLVFKGNFEFSVCPWSDEELYHSYHTCDLSKVEDKDYYYLNLDLVQRGVGSGSCGPQTRPEYCVEAKYYRFTYTQESIGF